MLSNEKKKERRETGEKCLGGLYRGFEFFFWLESPNNAGPRASPAVGKTCVWFAGNGGRRDLPRNEMFQGRNVLWLVRLRWKNAEEGSPRSG